MIPEPEEITGKIWSEREIFNVLMSLHSMPDDLPWYVRWMFRTWKMAITTVCRSLCTNFAHALLEDQIFNAIVDGMEEGE